MITVSEAFALAGFKFNKDCWIVCFRGSYGSPEEPDFKWVYGVPDPVGGHWLKFLPEEEGFGRSYLYGPQINLARLPAWDCYEALPDCVKSALAGSAPSSETKPSEPQAKEESSTIQILPPTYPYDTRASDWIIPIEPQSVPIQESDGETK